MSEEEREILQGLDDMKHLEINPEYKVRIINGILDLYNKEKEKNKELEKERKQFYEGELYTAKQLKNIERDRNKYFIHKSKIEELRDIDNIDYLQFKIKELLEERN